MAGIWLVGYEMMRKRIRPRRNGYEDDDANIGHMASVTYLYMPVMRVEH